MLIGTEEDADGTARERDLRPVTASAAADIIRPEGVIGTVLVQDGQFRLAAGNRVTGVVRGDVIELRVGRAPLVIDHDLVAAADVSVYVKDRLPGPEVADRLRPVVIEMAGIGHAPPPVAVSVFRGFPSQRLPRLYLSPEPRYGVLAVAHRLHLHAGFTWTAEPPAVL